MLILGSRVVVQAGQVRNRFNCPIRHRIFHDSTVMFPFTFTFQKKSQQLRHTLHMGTSFMHSWAGPGQTGLVTVPAGVPVRYQSESIVQALTVTLGQLKHLKLKHTCTFLLSSTLDPDLQTHDFPFIISTGIPGPIYTYIPYKHRRLRALSQAESVLPMENIIISRYQRKSVGVKSILPPGPGRYAYA